MTLYCKLGDKPKVYFSFKNSPEQIYESEISPIEVSVENFSIFGENYSPTGYQVSFYSPNNGIDLSRIVRAYTITDSGSGNAMTNRYSFDEIRCDGTSFKGVANIDPSTLRIDTNFTCPTISHNTLKSRLHIKKPSELIDIFTAEGDYPCTFNVACVDCPDGYCKIDCETYPGYCCINEAKIKSLINQLNV